MAFAPVTGYVLQYRLILLNRSVGAFSTDICLVLLFANILRLNFYLFRHYQIALLFQSLFMITAQLLLIKVCTQFREKPIQQASQVGLKGGKGGIQKKEEGEEEQDFWRWSKFEVYVKYILVFTIASFATSLVMKILDFAAYGELVGAVALLSESLLILPQIVQIFKEQRVGGISYMLIFLNLLGDIIKVYYFFLKDQPFQFVLCGVLQLLLDSFIVLQIAYFARKDRLTAIEEDAMGTNEQEGQSRMEEGENQLDGSLSQVTRLETALEQIGK